MVFSDTKVSFYLNGEEQSSKKIPQTINVMNPVTAASIGGGHGNQFLDGYVDDFRIYSKALSPMLIKDIYNGGER